MSDLTSQQLLADTLHQIATLKPEHFKLWPRERLYPAYEGVPQGPDYGPLLFFAYPFARKAGKHSCIAARGTEDLLSESDTCDYAAIQCGLQAICEAEGWVWQVGSTGVDNYQALISSSFTADPDDGLCDLALEDADTAVQALASAVRTALHKARP